jgi:hypothetical protein
MRRREFIVGLGGAARPLAVRARQVGTPSDSTLRSYRGERSSSLALASPAPGKGDHIPASSHCSKKSQ